MRPKTKGRVERIVRFVRERFVSGRGVSDLESFNGEALRWLEERANSRVHRITRERPCDRFTIERKALRPVQEYDIVLESSRVADAYGLVSVDGVRYSVPAQFARRPVLVQSRASGLTLIVEGETVAAHTYAAHGVRLVQDPLHLPPRPQPRHERFAQLGEVIADRLGEPGRRYVEAIESKVPHAPLMLLREVIERSDEYGVSVVSAAVERLLHFSIVKRGMLSTLCHRFGGTPRVAVAATALPHVDVEQRSLAVYDGAAA